MSTDIRDADVRTFDDCTAHQLTLRILDLKHLERW
jgi:hypothetical protein